MGKAVAGLFVGLIVGMYLTASYPESIITDFHRLRIPLLAPVAYSPVQEMPRSYHP